MNLKFLVTRLKHDLYRKWVKISVFSHFELEKYKYLTGEDLGYKPGVVEKPKFEYFSSGKVLIKY